MRKEIHISYGGEGHFFWHLGYQRTNEKGRPLAGERFSTSFVSLHCGEAICKLTMLNFRQCCQHTELLAQLFSERTRESGNRAATCCFLLQNGDSLNSDQTVKVSIKYESIFFHCFAPFSPQMFLKTCFRSLFSCACLKTEALKPSTTQLAALHPPAGFHLRKGEETKTFFVVM